MKAGPSGGLSLKNEIKTDVWALVGVVVKVPFRYNKRPTVHYRTFDFEIVSELRFVR